MPITFKSICTGAFDVNCWIVSSGTQAVVVDPGDDAALIIEALEECGSTPLAWLLTHGHADHLSALAACVHRHPAPVYLSKADQIWAFSPVNSIPPYYAAPEAPPSPLMNLEDGQILDFGAISLRVMATPGHSPGCVCFFEPQTRTLLSGDTLFRGSVGRTDLPGGDSRTLTNSLKKLCTLPDEIRILPGHGEETTLAAEKRSNPYLLK